LQNIFAELFDGQSSRNPVELCDLHQIIDSLVQVEELDLAAVRNRYRVAPNQLPRSRAVEESYFAKIKEDVLMPTLKEFPNSMRDGRETPSVIRPDTFRITTFAVSRRLVLTLIFNLQLSPC
jgi:hypothetical protein